MPRRLSLLIVLALAGCGGSGHAAADAGPSDAAVDPWVTLGGGVWVSPSCPGPGQPLAIRYAGALADATGLTVHHGFDGWTEVPGARSGPGSGGGAGWFIEAELTPHPAGGFVGRLDPPAGVRALHLTFRSSAGQWDSAAGRDYGLGIVFPFLGPFVTWDAGDDPATTLRVHFHSGYLCTGQVEFGTGGALDRSVSGPEARAMHHLRLTDLPPAAEVRYRVRCAGREASPIYTVRTASDLGVTMALLSDAQDSGETPRWSATVEALLVAHPEVEVVLFAGDATLNDRPGLWWLFFDRARELLATRALALVPGNHDTTGSGATRSTASLRGYLGLPEPDGLIRALRWGPAGFLLLDSGASTDFVMPGGAQYAWAAATLDAWAAAAPPWSFAALHVPPYNVGARHQSEQGLFRDLTGLLDGRLDWVLSGHEHLYQRLRPLRYNAVLAPSGQYGRGPDDGVGYLVLPPAGAWPTGGIISFEDEKAYYRDRLAYPVPAAESNEVPTENGFVIMKVEGETFTLRTYAIRGAAALVDEVQYVRP